MNRGFTLVEMLVVVVISAISLMALSVPFVGGRVYALSGNNQAEAQRDAQMVLRAMARAGRECKQYSLPVGFPPGATNLSFDNCPVDPIYPAGSRCFVGTPSTGTMILTSPNCQTPSTKVLINGVRSKVTAFTVTPIVANKVVNIKLTVTHQPTATSSRKETEVLETDLFLRNAT